ncbi:MAG: hypothetical protein H6756_03085 [Candidatus Omnitrophica bacterium]|nr:hypothetical protein [Candidatus Omnitrophota bacterium]
MKALKNLKTWIVTAALLMAGAPAWGQVFVTQVCVPPEPGCYCNDGPSGNVECRKYGLQDEGFYIRAWAGMGTVPKIRVNMSHISNTPPNIGIPECWDIVNNSGTEYFVPTSTRSEWNSFKLAALGGSFPGVTLTQCPVCGDGICTNTTTYWGFIEGCGSNDSMLGSPQTGDPMCNQDCGACPIVCGDGFCAAGAEHCTGGAGAGYNPCVECGSCSCGDAYYDCTGQCGTCPSCSPCCGDGTCDSGSGEDGITCAADCAAPVCGDTICNGTEDPCTCPGDCTVDVCGDGCCGATESCGADDTAPSCNSDCGACSCTGAVPINATLCSGDATGLTADTPNTSVLTCTAGTKCEYVCDSYADLVSGECRYCWDPTLNACYDIQPACAGYADCPAALTDGCTTVGANCRYNYTGDCSINPCGDEYTCGNCSFTCQGSVPANASLCPGDGSGVARGTNITLVAACTGGTKCEYICDTGYYYSGGVCVPYVCTGAVPANSTLCAGDDAGLMADTPRTAVNACTAPDKCEYQCDPGYQAVGNTCVPYVCTGPIDQFSQLCCVDYDMDMVCDPDDEGLSADTPRTLVDACTQPVKCEYVCRANYTRVGTTCVPDYMCLDPQPANATLCPDGSGYDDWDLTADTPKTAVETGACTAGTKCEYECLAGYIVDGNNCRLPMCTGSVAANATLCPGDDSGLAVDTAYTTVASCTGGTYCETTCDDGYQVNGANSCRANQCTGAVPANAEYCSGDDSNIPGNADVAVTLVAACSGGTKCETICSAGFELDVPGTSCVVEVFDCLGTPDPNATLCPGDDAGLLVDTPITTVAACTGGTMCEYTCNSGYHDSGVNQCDDNVCTGAVPANADLCAGDDTGIPGNADVTRSLVTSCTAGTWCEYTCGDGYHYDTGVCVPNVCTGAVPANSGLCPGDDTGIAGNADVARSLVPFCTAGTWCEYTCSDGYNYDTGVCDLNQCTGSVPANATLCAGDDTGLTGNSDVVRTAVGTCTAGVFCEYQCDDGYHESGGVCDPNVCIGAAPANASLCAGDDTSIPGNANVTRTAAAACTAGTKCEYTCDPLYVLDAGVCRPYMCTGVVDPNSTVCPGDDTGLSADTPRTTVSGCTGGTMCEYTCDSGYHDAGVNQCDANVCTGAPPLNAAICLGDDTNIPGNGDLALTLVPACTPGTWCEYACDDGYHLESGACAVNVCTGTIPINATVCTGDEANISGNSNVARTVVSSCTATKCEYTCDDGFNYNGSDCESLNQCIGAVPADATLCPGDDANIGGNSDVTRTVVPACTAGTKCEYTCVDTHHEDAGACIANVCLPPSYTNASYCSGDDSNVPGGADMVSQLVITCSATKCEYECDSGYSVNGGICEPDGEWIRVGLYLGQPAFSPACGDPFSGYPGYTLDRGDPCPASFLGDVYDCFDETIPGVGNRVELQCHQKL